jgi:hypothetical protein
MENRGTIVAHLCVFNVVTTKKKKVYVTEDGEGGKSIPSKNFSLTIFIRAAAKKKCWYFPGGMSIN